MLNMNDCNNCNPCPPCESQLPTICEALPLTANPKRIVVEGEDFCKGTIPEPANVSVLQFDEVNEISWRDGSVGNPIKLPQLQSNTTAATPKIMVLLANGTVREWMPSDTGDNFIAYWDGTTWRIGNLPSLFPSGNGVLVKTGGTLSFVNGTDGDLLQIIGGSIQFNSTITGSLPAGAIVPYPAATIPNGWLLCNGSLYGRTFADANPEPNLFAAIGTAYGSGDGLTNFAIPDLRGMFIRGFDNGRGIDPLRTLGSQQPYAMESHNHGGTTGSESAHTHTFSGSTGGQSVDHTHFVVADGAPTTLSSTNQIERDGFSYTLQGTTTAATLGLTSGTSNDHTHAISVTSSSGTAHSHTINSDGSTETRPVNVAMNWIIKT